MIECKDSLEFLKERKDYENDIIFADPPYVRPDGKLDYKVAKDFLDKWRMPDGAYWEAWFKEAYRSLKHGGYCLLFGIDRQTALFRYYAILAGFRTNQSLYWLKLSGFPKSADLSKQIDNHAGIEREIVGKKAGRAASPILDIRNNNLCAGIAGGIDCSNITAPATSLAQKYDGYRYSVAPLKQINEEIMVFQKPYKTGSCLHDVLAYEDGDKTCCCAAINIDSNRLPTQTELGRFQASSPLDARHGFNTNTMGGKFQEGSPLGRYPTQAFIQCSCEHVDGGVHTDPDCPCSRLDKQSGILQSGSSNGNAEIGESGAATPLRRGKLVSRNDSGGASRILHQCRYEIEDIDIWHYCPKVSSSERNAGGIECKHPTMKPISLLEKILRLLKTPNPQRICYPFAGVASEVIGGLKAGFDDYTACEISQEYVEIAEARIKHYSADIEPSDNQQFKELDMFE
jgi:DNA modification methylase